MIELQLLMSQSEKLTAHFVPSHALVFGPVNRPQLPANKMQNTSKALSRRLFLPRNTRIALLPSPRRIIGW